MIVSIEWVYWYRQALFYSLVLLWLVKLEEDLDTDECTDGQTREVRRTKRARDWSSHWQTKLFVLVWFCSEVWWLGTSMPINRRRIRNWCVPVTRSSIIRMVVECFDLDRHSSLWIGNSSSMSLHPALEVVSIEFGDYPVSVTCPRWFVSIGMRGSRCSPRLLSVDIQ